MTVLVLDGEIGIYFTDYMVFSVGLEVRMESLISAHSIPSFQPNDFVIELIILFSLNTQLVQLLK